MSHIDLDSTTAAWLEAARKAKAGIVKYQEIIDRAREHVEAAMGDAEEARVGGRAVVSWAWSKPSTYIDKKALEADHPGLAAQYAKTKKPSRPFKLLEDGQ